MMTRLAISGYRSLREVRVALGALNVVTGANGSGKSSLYRALKLLADIARPGNQGRKPMDGERLGRANAFAVRNGPSVRIRNGNGEWRQAYQHLVSFDSMMTACIQICCRPWRV
jgi:predicted ATPase